MRGLNWLTLRPTASSSNSLGSLRAQVCQCPGWGCRLKSLAFSKCLGNDIQHIRHLGILLQARGREGEQVTEGNVCHS